MPYGKYSFASVTARSLAEFGKYISDIEDLRERMVSWHFLSSMSTMVLSKLLFYCNW